MPDLIGFDDDLRISRIIADDEYIVIDVSFGSNSRSYCYLCDDATVREGDTVVVPVGGDEELKCVVVKSVDVVTKDTAPFPIEQCKKVIEVIPEERILG
jgi:primosomal protein N'